MFLLKKLNLCSAYFTCKISLLEQKSGKITVRKVEIGLLQSWKWLVQYSIIATILQKKYFFVHLCRTQEGEKGKEVGKTIKIKIHTISMNFQCKRDHFLGKRLNLHGNLLKEICIHETYFKRSWRSQSAC